MVFNSFSFIIFFIVFYFLFLIFPEIHKWKLFLLASFYFYAFPTPKYLILLISLTIIDFYCGKTIYKAKTKRLKTFFIATGILANLSSLFYFKYLNLLKDALNISLRTNFISNLSIILPIGISFYTFQGISYLIDVYRNQIQPEENFGIFALYIGAFPKLIAGPIERAKNLIPQLKAKIFLSEVNFQEALFLILTGYFKKIVVADNLSILVDKIYALPENYSGFILLFATIFFGFQIYCDFSGYVDIGRGIAKLLGINLTLNFQKPYLSTNITEFWRRWHISLSNWVRDYIYIPLGGNRKGKLRQYLSLLISWFIIGLWHGASLNFIVWGMYHGFILICHKITTLFKDFIHLPKIISTIITFFLVNMGWIFFRSKNIKEALYIFRKIFNLSLISNFKYQPGFLFSIYLILGLLFLEILDTKFNLRERIIKANVIIFALFSSIVIYSIILFSLKEPINFIYLQF